MMWEGDVLHSMLLCCWISRVLTKSCCDGEYYIVKKYVYCGQPEYLVTMPDIQVLSCGCDCGGFPSILLVMLLAEVKVSKVSQQLPSAVFVFPVASAFCGSTREDYM